MLLQESKVRDLLGMKPGDPFDSDAVDTLPQKCEKEPARIVAASFRSQKGCERKGY